MCNRNLIPGLAIVIKAKSCIGCDPSKRCCIVSAQCDELQFAYAEIYLEHGRAQSEMKCIVVANPYLVTVNTYNYTSVALVDLQGRRLS